MRGNPFIVNHIVKKYKISPFMCAVDGRSPFLIAIESNQTNVVKYLLSKQYVGALEKDTKGILDQIQSCDLYGNNPLHKACRFRNAEMLELLLDKEVGDMK